ncbi:hypothetical protein HYALB_00000513 [Hymenoscyphus albidus]|uniref:Zn(2)-C6 fungal-type domain-containing protein n=1 Tax=Hymenoscyphus albidus TaxID=595503 RepID=A0A9N9M592_9HELO|nr:hypothetical protein HYALB_00000513 [Hymenoscyphus albidus]
MNKTPPAGKPRRPHNKSRTGCTQCKAKKVKCDENKPICHKCESYRTPCSFLQTHPQLRGRPQALLPSNTQSRVALEKSPDSRQDSTPNTPISTSSQPAPATFTMLDLELLHSYVTAGIQTFAAFPEIHELYRKIIMEFAFKNDFVMYRVLALSALHMAYIHPEEASKYRFAADSHSATGLSLFLREISNLNPSNCEACFLFSTMTFLHAWAMQDISKPSTMFFLPTRWRDEWETPIRWIQLDRGSRAIIFTTWVDLSTGALAPIFGPWGKIGEDLYKQIKDDRLLADDKKALNHLAHAWDNDSNSEEIKAILSETLTTLKGTFNMLQSETPNVSNLAIVMAWFSYLSDDFLKLVEDKIPEALLLVAYFCVTLIRLPSMWWNDGRPENFLETILDELGDRWEEFTRWPIEQVLGNKKRSPITQDVVTA